MATNKYIVLSNSTGSGKRYRAIAMRTPLVRTDSIEYTVGGTVDKTSGPILDRFSYTLRVPQDVQEESEYGTMDDLKELFRLVYPQGTPSDVVTLTDHYGNQYTCFFTGDLNPEPLTTMLEGYNAWHIVQIDLQAIAEVESS